MTKANLTMNLVIHHGGKTYHLPMGMNREIPYEIRHHPFIEEKISKGYIVIIPEKTMEAKAVDEGIKDEAVENTEPETDRRKKKGKK